MDQAQLNWITNFIWGIADDTLRDVFVRGKYRDVILPMVVLQRLDAVLATTKDDVLKMHPSDGAKLGLKSGDSVKITSMAGTITTKLKLWEGVRPGTVAKCYGQGHWAYGRVAAKDYAKAQPRGGNNNEILVDDYDRLSGATARNGGFTGVKIQKV